MPAATPRTRERQDEALRLRESGLTIRQIQDALGFNAPQSVQGAIYAARARRNDSDLPARWHRGDPMPLPIPNVYLGRAFGVEIEYVGLYCSQMATALRGDGLDVVAPGYSHERMESWKIVPDGSVSRGAECVSPVLRGQDGADSLRAIATALRAHGATTSAATGLHVHIDAQDLSRDEILDVATIYARFQNEINRLFTANRNGNFYCQSVSGLARNYQDAKTGGRLAHYGLDDISNGRYRTVNLQSYAIHGTIEFRQHSGSLNGNKIIAWVEFLQALVLLVKHNVQIGEDVETLEELLALMVEHDYLSRPARANLKRRAAGRVSQVVRRRELLAASEAAQEVTA